MLHANRRGLVLLEAIFGVCLLGALAASFAVAAGMHQRSLQYLADQQATLRAAQEALANLQESGQATTLDPLAHVTVVPLGTRQGAFEWVEVRVDRENRHVALSGITKSRPTSAPATQPGGVP